MKTTFQYEHYYDYEELSDCLNYFKDYYPNLVKLSSIAMTPSHRHVWAVEITNLQTGSWEEKPAYYMDGNTHAGEVTGSMATMHFMDYILTNNKEESIQTLLATTTFYLIPRISPDGAEAYLKTPYYLRSVDRPYPSKEMEAGLHPEDLDGDGVIRKMRIKTKTGAWKASSMDPRLMVKRLPDEIEGEFYDVFDEGIIEQYNGIDIPIIHPKWNLDFNRNYPFGWFVEERQPGAGEYPLSNLETKAVVDFVIAHPNIGFVATMHTTGGILVYPPGTKPEKDGEPNDMRMYREIGAIATQEMGYPVVNVFDGFMQDQKKFPSGAFDDWCYHTQGIPAYTIELWNLLSRAGIKQEWPSRKTNQEEESDYAKQMAWIETHLGSDQIKPWTKVDHPQLVHEEVEVGGFPFKFTVQNCPPPFLLQEVEKTTKFCLRNAAALPRLQLEQFAINKLTSTLYEVKVKLSNVGYLPTYLCDEAINIKKNKPIEIVCETEGKLLQKSKQTLTKLEGYGRSNASYRYHGIQPNPHDPLQVIVTYLIEGKPQDRVTIVAKSEKAGTCQLNLVLA